MAGLLDDLFDPATMAKLKEMSQPDAQQRESAMQQGILATGLGILANNSGHYGAFSPAIGAGGMVGMNTYNNTLQQQQRDAMEQLQMGSMLSKMRKDSELQDRQSKFMDTIPAMFGNQTQAAPRPYQGQVSGNFQVGNQQQADMLESDYQKLLKVNPEEASKVRESLVQQGIIKPQTQQAAPGWQNVMQAGVQASVAGLKGGEQLMKAADLMQPSIQYLDTGAGLMPYSKNGMPLPGAQMITKSMSPKEAADVQAKNAELAFKGVIVPSGNQAGGLGVQPQAGNGVSPESQNQIVTKGRESFNDNWIKSTYQPVQDLGNAANSIRGQVQTLRQIPIESGWGTEAMAGAANVLSGLGVAPKNAEMFAANAQKFQQVASERLWTVLNNAKGPQTEGDADRAKQTFVSLKNRPEANQFILDLAEATANRDVMKSGFYQDGYGIAKKDGAYERVDSEWRKINPSIWSDPIMQKWVRK